MICIVSRVTTSIRLAPWARKAFYNNCVKSGNGAPFVCTKCIKEASTRAMHMYGSEAYTKGAPGSAL
jgi:hypothetical protein